MAKAQTSAPSTKVGHFIREWRKHRGLTLEALAEKVGLTHGSISQLERGEINYTQPTLEAIASALGCNAGELIMAPPDGPPLTRKKQHRLAALMDAASRLSDKQIEGLVAILPAPQVPGPLKAPDPELPPVPPSKVRSG